MGKKDVEKKLREYLKKRMPGMRKDSLDLRVAILLTLIERGKEGAVFAREFLKINRGIRYHLKKLREAGCLRTVLSEVNRFVVDYAEPPGRRFKKGLRNILKARSLRSRRMTEHAEIDALVQDVLLEETGSSSVTEAERKIVSSPDFRIEKTRHKRYNKVVAVLKEKGVATLGYDFLVWRNTAQPWRPGDDFARRFM